ncbi:MAG: DUF1631 domain-containing protein [Rhodoferax sp.]|nr:DUF1631 domain-containing protein [Rhodoferax sp.]
MNDAAARALVLRHAQTLINKTLAFFAERQDAQIKALRSHLFDMVDSRPHTSQAQNLRAAAGLLDKQAALFNRSLQLALREAIEDEIEAIVPGSLKILRPADESGNSSGPRSMALLDVDEIERHLLVDRVAQPFNARYEAALKPLTQSVGVLFGQEEFSLTDNPFRPATLIRAHSLAWHVSQFDPKVVEDFISVFEPQHCGDWSVLYAALSENLVRAGFAPRAAHRIKRSVGGDSASAPPRSAASDSTAGAGSGDSTSIAPGGEPTAAAAPAGMVQSMAERARSFLQKLGFGRAADGSAQAGGGAGGGSGGGAGGGAGGTGFGGSHGAHTPADPGLLGFLGGLQAGTGESTLPPWVAGQDFIGQNLLRQIGTREEVKRAPELDRGTIDALAEVFDYVFADAAIPVQLKYVIGRLQIPVLKAAMIDRDFFLTSEHPARQLVDALASASVAWMPQSGDTDPLYCKIDTTVKRVLTEFDNDLALFRTLLGELNAFVGHIDVTAQQHIAPVVRQQRTGEAHEAALSHADEVIHQCIQASSAQEPLLPFLLPFLTQQWREVMARAWLNQAAAPAQWAETLETMDQMVWSTMFKADTHERARLVALLPELVRKLNSQLDALGWKGDERAAFTRNLIATHMKAIRSPKSAPAPLESGLESGPDDAQTEAGETALRALEVRRAQQQPDQFDQFDAMAHELTQGLWFDFAGETGTVRRYRLGWVSPKRTRLLFTNRDGFEAFVHSERAVAELLRQGRLAVLDQQPIVSRAIDQIMAAAATAPAPVDLELA